MVCDAGKTYAIRKRAIFESRVDREWNIGKLQSAHV